MFSRECPRSRAVRDGSAHGSEQLTADVETCAPVLTDVNDIEASSSDLLDPSARDQ